MPNDPKTSSGIMEAIATLAARQILGWILLTSAASKLLNLDSFRNELARYPLVSRSLARWSAPLVPFAEILIASSLVLGAYWRLGAIASFALLAIFLIAVSAAITSGRRDGCGCGGLVPTKTLGPGHVATIVILGALAAFVASAERTSAALNLPWHSLLLSQVHSSPDQSSLLVGIVVANALLVSLAFSATWDLRRRRAGIDLVTGGA